MIDFDTLDFRVVDEKGQDIFNKPLEELEKVEAKEVEKIFK